MNRENWLKRAVEELTTEYFGVRQLQFEHEIRISTGWCRGSNKAIGQCWSHRCSEGGYVEIFVAPVLVDPVEVLGVVLHEMIHAQLGTDKKHGKEFKVLADEFGLAGRVTATFVAKDSALFAELEAMAKELGEYPHKALLPKTEEKKGGESKGGWLRFKSKTADDYRCMVSPVSLREHGIPKDPWGEELIPTKEA